ncbi:PTS mannitol transporter subunit IICBA [uncultured Alistipes sp.]|uniref:PTS mannitol transporter subunit IICBA n=1 Tax=Alistipes TaxID=239759 RepID=UPI00266B647B|nr:PTS mannitol transporter subunit IICBA [uncultured Alistipes sp.]
MQQHVQRFGRALSAMVMPNIGAFIAWGFITALFIPTGWWPSPTLAQLVDPMLVYLLPLLIAYTAGRNVAGERGGVIGAIATAGVIVGSEIPMFIGAMIMGPLAGYVIKQFDRLIDGKVKAGFEMLVNNFSIGILGMLLAILGFYAIGTIVSELTEWISLCAAWIIEHSLLPLVSIFVEPAKVLFLNNAINHGIFSPIGLEQARETGESIMFLLETNPGPGLGVLLAYWMFAEGNAKESAPGAVIIQFFGGIHEIYFPYILARPVLILAPIAGSAAGLLFYSLTDAGLVAPASPGSIISVLAMAPKGKTVVVLLGIVISAIVSFVVASPFVRRASQRNRTLPENRFKYNPAATTGTSAASDGRIRKIVFACDAGMGSSALGATRFRNRTEDLGIDVEVTNSSVDAIPKDADVVVSQAVLADRVERSAPQAEKVVINNFLGDENLDALLEELRRRNGEDEAARGSGVKVRQDGENDVLRPENILVGLASESKEAAIRRAGELLVRGGYVEEPYVDAMLRREQLATTYLGMGIAIPHGTSDAKERVLRSGIVVLQYPEGVDFGDEKAHLVIGIAGVGDEHLDILARLSASLEDDDLLQRLLSTHDPKVIYNALK